jgi:hypothetical protein
VETLGDLLWVFTWSLHPFKRMAFMQSLLHPFSSHSFVFGCTTESNVNKSFDAISIPTAGSIDLFSVLEKISKGNWCEFQLSQFPTTDADYVINDWITPSTKPNLHFATALSEILTWIWCLCTSYPHHEIYSSNNDVANCFQCIPHHLSMVSMMLLMWGAYPATPLRYPCRLSYIHGFYGSTKTLPSH